MRLACVDPKAGRGGEAPTIIRPGDLALANVADPNSIPLDPMTLYVISRPHADPMIPNNEDLPLYSCPQMCMSVLPYQILH